MGGGLAEWRRGGVADNGWWVAGRERRVAGNGWQVAGNGWRVAGDG